LILCGEEKSESSHLPNGWLHYDDDFKLQED